jgi:peptidoglycan hydrolase-like protein with peptidoglycan-binding domain
MKTGINHIFISGLLVLGSFGVLANTASAAYFDNAPAPRCDVQINRTLQTGSEGVDVTVLQNFLNRAGYLFATPNGYFGPATKAAVRGFQSENYIPTTGSVGPATLNAINERMCDTDLHATNYGSYDSYTNYGGYSSGTTYVDQYDPFVQVISPVVNSPVVYTNPQNNVAATPAYNTYGTNIVSNSVISPVVNQTFPAIAPASTNIASTNIIYSPYIGYTYGITPASGSLTITTPVANSVYNEGDTVNLAWTTANLNANGYTILLENTSTGQSKAVTTTTGNNASFVLSKDVLDAVCAGACNNNQQGTFRIVVTTPLRDISGNVSTFRAAVAPITITRPYSNFGTVSITASKTPVNSGELFKLYVNIPTGASWNANVYAQYAFKIHAVCPSSVTVMIAGVPCGQDFAIPYAPTFFQSEIPAAITNASWYQQNVSFVLTVTTLSGQVIGTSQTNVVVNQTPFNW